MKVRTSLEYYKVDNMSFVQGYPLLLTCHLNCTTHGRGDEVALVAFSSILAVLVTSVGCGHVTGVKSCMYLATQPHLTRVLGLGGSPGGLQH